MCVGHGIDMFDCVLPTRNARNARVMTPEGDLNLRNARYRLDGAPIQADCACYACRNFSRAYLRHLHKAGEILFSTLASIHNLHYLLDLMRQARAAIEAGEYAAFRDEVLGRRAAGEGDGG
jgi:queuine tRNA-ribosyltransferase